MAVLPELRTLDGSLEVEAVCPICLDFYSSPVYLSCAHVFCLECTTNWMSKGKENLILICPLCREENKRPIMHDWILRELISLIKQHGPLLKQYKGQITGPLQSCSEEKTLETKTGDSSLVCSNDLRGVCCEKPGHNLEDPRRLTPLGPVVDSFHNSLVCPEVDVGKGKECAPVVGKEPISRRKPAITCMIPDLPPRPLSRTAHIPPWSSEEVKVGKSRDCSKCL